MLYVSLYRLSEMGPRVISLLITCILSSIFFWGGGGGDKMSEYLHKLVC